MSHQVALTAGQALFSPVGAGFHQFGQQAAQKVVVSTPLFMEKLSHFSQAQQILKASVLAQDVQAATPLAESVGALQGIVTQAWHSDISDTMGRFTHISTFMMKNQQVRAKLVIGISQQLVNFVSMFWKEVC